MKHIKLTVLSWLQRVMAIGAALLLMRLVSSVHGDAGVIFIGVTAAISGWIGMFDLGSFIVSPQLVSRNFREGRWRSSTAFVSLGLGVLAMLLMFGSVILWILFGWGWPATILQHAESHWVSILFLVSALGIGGSLGWRWRLARGEQLRAIGLQVLAQIVGATGAALYIISQQRHSDLALSALISIFPQMVVQQFHLWSAVVEGGRSVWLFFGKLSSRVRRILVKRHAKSLLFSVMCMIIHQSDVLVVASLVDQGAVLAGYILASKMFFSFIPIITAALQSHSPVLTRCWSDRDVLGMRKVIFQVLVANMLAATVFTIVLATQRTWIFPLLAPGSTEVPPASLLLVFGVYLLIRVWTDLWSQVLLGASDYWSNIIIAGIQALVTMALMMAMVPFWGGLGAVLALIFGFLGTASWFLPWRVACQLGKLPIWR